MRRRQVRRGHTAARAGRRLLSAAAGGGRPAPEPEAAWKRLVLGAPAMAAVVAASNYLVQFPLNDWATLGTLTYPVSYLLTDLNNRLHGPEKAR